VNGQWLLRFDPEWFLSGVTANKAAAQDGVVEPGQPVPNDNYRVDEGHRLFTYVVPGDAKVTVITNRGNPAQLGATPVTVAELAKIVDGTSTIKLFEPLDSGVWLTIKGDKAVAIDHQYQP
jgi:sugar lactone lactonase YvrE